MDLEQFLMQFHFTSIDSLHQSIVFGAVTIDDYTVKISDLIRHPYEFAVVGSVVRADRSSYVVNEDHLS